MGDRIRMTTGDAMGFIVNRLNASLDNYIGAPKGEDWEPSTSEWNRVYESTKAWMNTVSQMTRSAVHRGPDGKPLTAMAMTSLFFDAMRTGDTQVVNTLVVLREPLKCIHIQLDLEEFDGEEREEGEAPEVGGAQQAEEQESAG